MGTTIVTTSDVAIEMKSSSGMVFEAFRTTDLDFGATGASTPTTITPDGAVNGPSDPAEISAGGVITFNQKGYFAVHACVVVGRSTTSGIAKILGRIVKNGTPGDPFTYCIWSEGDDYIGQCYTNTSDVFNINDTLSFEIWSNDGDTKDGELVIISNPPPSYPTSPSFMVMVSQLWNIP